MTNRLKNLVKQRAKKENKSIINIMKSLEKTIPAKRFGTTEEIANLVMFLVSKEASYINGVNLNIDGSLIKGY